MTGFPRPMVGHMSDRGFWHSGARSVCPKCDNDFRNNAGVRLSTRRESSKVLT